MGEALRDVRCKVCGQVLFHASGLARVEIVCPRHRNDERHRQPQTFVLNDRVAGVKKMC